MIVYAVDISQITQKQYSDLYAKASTERQIRADRCRSREDAACCLIAEALLRYAAKQLAGLSEFALEINAHGKPRIQGREDLQFNLSHSGRWVVLAWGGTQVGIDVQENRMNVKKAQITRRFFGQSEQKFVFEKEAEFDRRFLQIWTAKESYLKYLGTGLQRPMNSFDVCTMTEPRFVTHWLEDACVTLCTTEEKQEMQLLEMETLI